MIVGFIVNNMNSTPKTPRILQIIPKLDMGGAERGTIDLALYLKKNNIASFVASGGGHLVYVLNKHEIPHYTLPLYSKNPFVIMLNALRLRKILKAHHINVIDVRSRAPAWSAWLTTRRTHIKLVTSFHGMYGYGNLFKFFYNQVMTKGNIIVSVSNFITKHIEKIYKVSPKKIVTIPRGIDPDIFAPSKVPQLRLETLIHKFRLPEDKFVILLSGRLSRPKGHEVLLEALSYLRHKDYICLFVGKTKNSAYKKELEKQAETYGVADKLFIKESCADMPALYKLATVAVMPSIWPESFGRVAIEAGAMGCPIIASDHGGVKEIVLHGETGYLFPNEDSKALAKYIDKVLDFNAEERSIFSKKAIHHIQDTFTNKQMFAKTLRAYKNLVS